MTAPSRIIIGDSFEVLPTIESGSHDSCVTDGPYGIRFMGKAWDGADIEAKINQRRAIESRDPGGERFNREGRRSAGINAGYRSAAAEAGKYARGAEANRAFEEFSYRWASEMFRILKPGSHLVSFASPRTYHRMVCGIEEAGFEIRDQLSWLFGSGFPKSHNLEDPFEGWGTALKPAFEPIVLARKPLAGTVAENMTAHQVGALNVKATVIPFLDEADERQAKEKNQHADPNNGARRNHIFGKHDAPRSNYEASGRWPANVLHDGSFEVLRLLGENARFMYCAKASKEDREAGLAIAGIEPKPFSRSGGAQNALGAGEDYEAAQTIGFNRIDTRRNTHPTVKPTDLMRWLCRLITPAGGRVIDPFFGSGSTGRGAVIEGFSFTGIERESEYGPIARARVVDAAGPLLANVEITRAA